MFHFGENYFRPSRFHGVFVLSIPFLSTKLFWTEALPRIYVHGVWRFPVVRFPFARLLFSETFLPTKFSDPRSFRKFPLFQICPVSSGFPSEILAPSGKFVYSNLAHRRFPFAKLLFIHSLASQRSFLFSKNSRIRNSESLVRRAFSRCSFARVTPSYCSLPF